MRFVLDMGLSPKTTEFLRDLGHEATHLMAASGARLPSVVLFRLRSMRPENVNRHLRLVLEHHSDDLRKGAILTVTEGRIRARSLPIDAA